MAKQQTTDVKVRLLIEGFEGLNKIKSSFRDLGKVTDLTAKDIAGVRASLNQIAKEAGNTEAVNAGLISVFKALRAQADKCGDTYEALSADLRRLNEVSRGATDSLMAQRDAVLASTASITQNVAALTQQRDALVALRAQTRESSQAFEQFSGDIERVEARLGNLAQVNRDFNRAITQGTAATAAGAQVSLAAITQGISLRRAEIAAIDLLTKEQRKEAENVRERIRLQRSLNIALTQQGILRFQESARAGRERVRAAGRTFNSGTLTRGSLSPEGMADRFGLGGQIPNTTAGLNQELSELGERLINTYRHTENYIEVQLRLAAVQREVTAATQGYAARLVADLDTGTTISSQKNLREAIAALRSEMVELDQSTTEGTRLYAQQAGEADRLQQQLDKLARAYRSVSNASRASAAEGNPRVTVGGERPFVSEMDRQKQRRDASVEQRAEFDRLTAAADTSSMQAVDALQSAKRTMAEADVSAAQKLDQIKDELAAKDIQRINRVHKQELENFDQKLQLDIRAQRIAETKQAMGFYAQSELSPLYGRIANLGGSEAERQQQFMGRNPTQVFNDIVESFNAGGRPVDLKKRGTDIGDSLAEGIAEGAKGSAAIATGARDFVDKWLKTFKAAFRIKSPSGESEEKIGIPIGQGIGQGILKGINGFKAQIKAAILDLTAQVGKAPLPLSLGPGSPLADRAQSQLARSTTRTSTYLPLTRLMGEGVLGSEAMSVAAERRMFENRSRVIPLGGSVPGGPQAYPSALSLQDRRGLRGTAGIPGAGLESMIVSAVIKGVSRTGALAGPLNRPQTITVNIPSLQRPGISAGATRAAQSPLPVFSAPTQPTPLQATLPGMGYRMGGASAPNFPIDGPLRGLTGPTGQKAAAASLTEAISKYRKAADNFWFSETSTFQTIRNIIGSGAQVAASKGALALSNVRLNTAGLTAAATKLTNLPSTTISNISSLLSGQGAKLTTTLQASGTQLRTQFTKLQTSADTLKTSTAQIFTGIGTGLTQRASTFRSGLTANLPFFGGGGGSGGPPIPPFPPAPPPPPPLPPTGGSSESFAKLNNGLKEFGPLSRRSVESIQALGGALQDFKNKLSPIDDQYALINKKIEQQEKLIQRELTTRQRRQRAPLTGMQAAQGVGAAISGGIFGGPEGLLGGLGGLAVGGVGGAFAGAAAGAQVGMFRQQIAATADYAAGIGKMQIALRGVAGSQIAYDTAIRAAAKATRELNIPQEEATRGLTRLSAAVLGAGGTMGDSTFAFRAVSEAIKATGGNAEQVDGALLALTQVFSKGKVSAEELNQIAERLPGTFTLFAQAAGKTGPELQKGLQQGEIGLNDLMKFLELASTTYGRTALQIAASSQDAGARLAVAFQAMRLEVGNAVQPLGAELQDSFAKFITEITPDVVDSVKGIADAFKFFKDSSVAQGLVEFALKIGGITLALKALRGVAGTTTAINLANWFTGTAAAGKITGDVLQTTSVKAAGLGGNLLKARTALSLLTTAAAKPVVLTIVILSVIEAINRIREARDAFEDFKKSTKQPGASNWLKDIGGSALSADQLKAQKAPLDAAIKSNKFEIAKLQKEKRNLELQALNVATGSEAAPINTEIVTVTAKIQTAQQNIKNAESRLAAVNKALASASNKPAKRSDFDTPGGNEDSTKAAEKARRDAEAAAAEQQRLNEAIAKARIALADAVFRNDMELIRKRYEYEQELESKKRDLFVKSQTGAARETAGLISGFLGELQTLTNRLTAAGEVVQGATQDLKSAKAMAATTISPTGAVSAAGRYMQGGIGPKGPNQYGPHFDIKRSDGGFYSRTALDPYVQVNGRPLSSGVTVPGGEYGAPRSYGGHAGRDYAFGGSAAMTLTGGAKWMGNQKGDYGDATAFMTPDGKVYKVIHGKFEGTAAAGRQPTGVAAAARRDVAAEGQVSIATANLDKALAAQAQTKNQVEALTGIADKSFVLDFTEALRVQNAALADSASITELRNKLLLAGERPETIDAEIRKAEAIQRSTQQTDLAAKALKALDDAGLGGSVAATSLRDGIAAHNAEIAKFKKLTDAATAAQITFNEAMRTRQDDRIGMGVREGALAYVESIGTMREATAQLTQTGIKGVEDALFSLVTTGTANFREFAAEILKQSARMILQLTIQRVLMQIIGAIGGAGAGLSDLSAPATINNPLGVLNANGNAFASNNIIPYANGGIVNRPTMFKFAHGGAMATGVMGEAGPEAIMPLKRGADGKLGVASAGGSGVTVNVSVDAKGTQVQGDPGQGAQLGRVIAGAVQQELIKQQRPGGLLAGAK
jgi:lambda family phage tail tape measure protein